MPSNHSSIIAPAVEEVDRIAALLPAVNRNLQITNCYCELSAAFALRTGVVANWCTFATWASKQAGVTIRNEDLKRAIENALRNDPAISALLEIIGQHARKLGGSQQLNESALKKLISDAAARAGDAVARGNKKVFEEIGHEFARFIATCTNDDVYKQSTIDDFCSKLSKGPPPDGQDLLCKAFTNYYISFFETDLNNREELRLLANLQIGFHEQTRLQPEISESLNAALPDPQQVRDYVSDILVNSKTVWGKILYFFQWIIGKTNLFKRSIDSLVHAAEGHIHKIITEHLMTITFPPANVLHLSRDLNLVFPEDLKQIQNAELLVLLSEVDPSIDDLHGDAATDWSDLKQRMRFIAGLFRCYHNTKELFDPAFTAEQVNVLKSGGIPEGVL